MNAHTRATSQPPFQFRFRSPGQPVEGPVQYAFGPCELGMLLLGRSRHGVCAMLIDDHETALLAALRAALPAVPCIAAPQELRHELTQAVLCVDGAQADGSLTLDLGGTLFQQRVWRALLAIPTGQTRSYGELAATLGLPTRAARAVGGACAVNLLAVAVPCHRVVRGDGTIANYRWGAARKRALLAREKRHDEGPKVRRSERPNAS